MTPGSEKTFVINELATGCCSHRQKSTLALIEQGKITGTAYTNAFQQGAMAGKYALDLLSGVKKKGDKTDLIKVPPLAATKDTVSQIKPEDRW